MKTVRILVWILSACFASVAWGQQPTCGVYTPWTEFHRHNMMRWNRCEKVLNVNNVGNLALKWSYATLGPVSEPAIANRMLYVGSQDHNVYALDARTGAKVWSYTTGGAVESSPVVADGVVYVGSEDFNVYTLNALTGTKLWSYTTGKHLVSSLVPPNGVVSSPTVENGVVYVASEDNNVYALNGRTGAKL
jgi:outer membrane protein assembly factor BamB